MGSYRSVYFDIVNRIHGEIADTDTLLAGNISPTAGPLTLTGSPLQLEVNINSHLFATGYDFGDPTHRIGTIYCSTLNADNIVGPIDVTGTNYNSWAVNQDAVPTTPENVGVTFVIKWG